MESVKAMTSVQWYSVEEESCIGEVGRLSYNEVERLSAPARALEFPAPTVHRGARVTVYTPHPKGFQSLKVLARFQEKLGKRSGSSTSTAHLSHEGCYYIRRKIGTAVYGSVRMGVVMKRRKCLPREEAYLTQGSNILRSISETDEDLDTNGSDTSSSKHANSFSDDEETKGHSVWEFTQKVVAIKMISWESVMRMRGRNLEDPIKEVAAMQLLGNYHDHIISAIDVLQDSKYLYIVMPYCAGGDLYNHTINALETRRNGRLDEDEVRFWFRQIVSALHHFQIKGICHRDLCLENILLHKNKCKIIDLGLSLRVPHIDPNNRQLTTDVSSGTARCLMRRSGQGGNWTYIAPEIVANHDYFDGFAIDLWSAGVILFIMLVGVTPFHWAHDSDEHFNLISSQGRLKEALSSWQISLSEEACDLLQNMLWKYPAKRYTLYEIINHPWLKKDEQ